MLPAPRETGYFIQVRPQVRLHVVTTGAEDAPPVILLHGYPEFWWSWRYQLRFLANNGYRAIAPDLRGVNYSSKPRTGYDPETMAGDILGLMDAYHYEKATIIGHDYGGFIGYVMAMLFPKRVHKLVAISTLHPARWIGQHRAERRALGLVARLAALGQRIFTPLIANANHTIGVGRMMLWMAHNKQAFPHPVRLEHSRAYERSAQTATIYIPEMIAWLRDHMPVHPTIPHPLLSLWSERDFSAPVWVARSINESIPHAKLVTVPKAGHWSQQEQPEFVNDAILKFLRDF